MIHRFNATIEIPADFSTETDKLIQIHMEIQLTQNSQNNLERELTFPNFRTFYKAAVVEWCDTAI